MRKGEYWREIRYSTYLHGSWYLATRHLRVLLQDRQYMFRQADTTTRQSTYAQHGSFIPCLSFSDFSD